MWLSEFLRLFPEATRRVTGKPQDLYELESKFKSLRGTIPIRVGSRELAIIKDSECWSYPKWWPKYSAELAEAIELPIGMKSVVDQRKAIQLLYERLKHIEVVSVVLRFTFPEYFGIMSPPTLSLLNMVPARGEQHPEYYSRYLGNLRALSLGHQHEDRALCRLANVDMALWAAAHLSIYSEFEALTLGMQSDAGFQEMRLRNMSECLADYWTGSLEQRLLLADVLLTRDHMLAGLVGSRCFEEILQLVAQRFNISAGDYEDRDQTLNYLIRKISKNKEILRHLDVSGDKLNEWRSACRNPLVHGRPVANKQAGSSLAGFEDCPDDFRCLRQMAKREAHS